MSTLAIVIPAYKITFLDEALLSISNQTCKDFVLYIGDDASPDDIKRVIDKYSHEMTIKYHRFDTNQGGTDLVAQWERCIDMVQDEEWIWLFSDDDTIDTNCVEAFYNQLKTNDTFDIYHFNVNIINTEGTIIKNEIVLKYPVLIDHYTYYKRKLSGKLSSYVVEYIFNKETFYKSGRFQNFDLAWGSDVATWVKLSYAKNMCTIPVSTVNWRRSLLNISPNNSELMVIRKLNSVIKFLSWSKKYFELKGRNVKWFNHFIFLKQLKFFSPYLSKLELNIATRKYAKTTISPKCIYHSLKFLLWFYIKLKP